MQFPTDHRDARMEHLGPAETMYGETPEDAAATWDQQGPPRIGRLQRMLQPLGTKRDHHIQGDSKGCYNHLGTFLHSWAEGWGWSQQAQICPFSPCPLKSGDNSLPVAWDWQETVRCWMVPASRPQTYCFTHSLSQQLHLSLFHIVGSLGRLK